MKCSSILPFLFGCAFIVTSVIRPPHTNGAGAAVADGKALFLAKCAACHQASGSGGGPFPPLAANPFVTADDTEPLITTVLNGRTGAMQANGRTYGGVMPAWKGQISDVEIAAVLSYVRSAWGNKAAIVSAEQIAAASAPSGLSGSQIFATKCAACHQARGQGTESIPPLAANPAVVTSDPTAMIAIIVKGRSGPLVVKGRTYNGKMPAWSGQLSNADIAGVATYVRSAWGNAASGVTEQQVAAAGPAVLATVGASVFATNCARCHQASGQGLGQTIPALAGNKDVLAANPERIVGTVERGHNLMPSWKGQLTPSDIAAVLTYVRSAWGNSAAAVTVQDVAAVK